MGHFQVRREFEDLMLETIDMSVFHDMEPGDNLILVQDLEEEVITDTNLCPPPPPTPNHGLCHIYTCILTFTHSNSLSYRSLFLEISCITLPMYIILNSDTICFVVL